MVMYVHVHRGAAMETLQLGTHLVTRLRGAAKGKDETTLSKDVAYSCFTRRYTDSPNVLRVHHITLNGSCTNDCHHCEGPNEVRADTPGQ